MKLLRSLLVPAFAGAALFAPAVHAGLFEDEEARKAILDLRQRVEQQRQGAAGDTQRLTEENAQMRRSVLELQRQLVAAQLRCTSLELKMADLEKRLETTSALEPAEIRPATPAEMAYCGINLTKRSQALRLHRQGNAPETIARNLGVAKGEVNLMLKLHKIIVDTANEGKKV